MRYAIVLLASAVLGYAHAEPVPAFDINTLMARAAATHPSVTSAVYEHTAATEGYTAAKMGFLPTPSINANAVRGDNTVSLVVRQPLWTGGKLTAETNQALYDQKAAEALVLEKSQEVAKNVAGVWQEWLYAKALIKMYDNNLAVLAKFNDMMQRRINQGVSARIELDLVQSRILQDTNARTAAIQQQHIAQMRLAQMTGTPIIDGTVQMNAIIGYVLEHSKDFDTLAFAQTGTAHPSVLRQAFLSQSAEQAAKARKAALYPAVYLQYQYDHSSHRKGNSEWSVGLAYSPGAGFGNAALSRASDARTQSIRQSQEVARRAAQEAIQVQYQQFISAKDQQLSLLQALAGSKLVVESYQRQFIAGRKSWLEVLNAVREHSQYAQQLAAAQTQMIGAFFKLQVDFGQMPWQQGQSISEPAPWNWQQALQDFSEQHLGALPQGETQPYAIELDFDNADLPNSDAPNSNAPNSNTLNSDAPNDSVPSDAIPTNTALFEVAEVADNTLPTDNNNSTNPNNINTNANTNNANTNNANTHENHTKAMQPTNSKPTKRPQKTKRTRR